MRTFLLAWNPKRWNWADIENAVATTQRRGFVDDTWSCGRSRRIEKGDRVFLLRQGVPPKGIMASGSVISEVFESAHWDKNRTKEKALFIKVRFDTLLNPDDDETKILRRDMLRGGNLGRVHWDTQMSGIEIPPEAAVELENLWLQFLGHSGQQQIVLPEEVVTPEQYSEGSTRQISVNIYERNPIARKKCIEHYGVRCSVCDFDFETVFGELGREFIHVHHLKPLSAIRSEYRVDPVEDLRPICPNCHAMLHRDNEMRSIEQLKRIIRTK